VLYSSKNAMEERKQQLGFSILELIFVLMLMGIFTACIAIKPFRPKGDVAYETKVALSEAVFLARFHSISPATPIVLALTTTNSFSFTNKNFVLEIKKKDQRGNLETKYRKDLNSKISSCEFVNFPRGCRSSDIPKNPFKAGSISQESILFEEKFFIPFQLKFSFDNKELYVVVDTNTQTYIYEQKQ
jgi:hypothetical protein